MDAIILAPLVETGWDDVLQEAKDAEIPVLIIDRNVTADPSLFITRVASDFVYEGRLAAAWLASATADRTECNIVELQGTVGSSPAIDRGTGFTDVLALFPTMKIVASASPAISPALVARPSWKASSARWTRPRFAQCGRITTTC